MPLFKLADIDLFFLSQAIDSAEGGWFDLTTGESYPIMSGTIVGLENEDEDFDPDDLGWIGVGMKPPDDDFEDMAIFAGAVKDPGLFRRLDDAVRGEAVSRFLDVVHTTEEQIGRTFSAFSDVRVEIRAIEWLAWLTVIDADEAAEAIGQRQAECDRLLALVSAATDRSR